MGLLTFLMHSQATIAFAPVAVLRETAPNSFPFAEIYTSVIKKVNRNMPGGCCQRAFDSALKLRLFVT